MNKDWVLHRQKCLQHPVDHSYSGNTAAGKCSIKMSDGREEPEASEMEKTEGMHTGGSRSKVKKRCGGNGSCVQ